MPHSALLQLTVTLPQDCPEWMCLVMHTRFWNDHQCGSPWTATLLCSMPMCTAKPTSAVNFVTKSLWDGAVQRGSLPLRCFSAVVFKILECGSQSKGKLTWIQEVDKGGNTVTCSSRVFGKLPQHGCRWTAGVPDFRNLNQGDWGSVGREQNNRITYGILLWPDHCIKLTESLPIQPNLTFCCIPFLFSVSFFSDSLSYTFFIAFLMLYYTDWKTFGCILLPSIAEQ